MPSRRTYIALAGASATGLGIFGLPYYSSGWGDGTCAVGSTTTAEIGPAAGSFPTYHGGADHAGFVPDTTGPAVDPRSNTEYWHAELGHGPLAMQGPHFAAVAGGRVFVTTLHDVYALDQADGSQAWCTVAGGTAMTAPTVADGTVVVGTELGDGTHGVMAFDATDGTRRWRAPDYGPFAQPIGLVTMAPTVADGRVFVGTGQQPTLTALGLESGEVLWEATLNGAGVSSPAVDDEYAYVQYEGGLAAVSLQDGFVEWETSAGAVQFPPTLGDGRIYAPMTETAVGAWDAVDGRRLWGYEGTTDEPRSICVAGNDLVVSTENALHVLDASSGRQRWTKSVEDVRSAVRSDENGAPNRLRQCLVTAQRIYLGVDGGLAVLDRDDGTVRWHRTFPTEDRGDVYVAGTPHALAIAGGVVYVLTETGTVFAIGA